jgi:hypothetical protein
MGRLGGWTRAIRALFEPSPLTFASGDYQSRTEEMNRSVALANAAAAIERGKTPGALTAGGLQARSDEIVARDAANYAAAGMDPVGDRIASALERIASAMEKGQRDRRTDWGN